MNDTSPSPSGRRFRKLRIAFSAACGILCLLLIVLWVRSITTYDYAQGTVFPQLAPNGKLRATHLTIHSYGNVLSVIWATDSTATKFPPWRYGSRPTRTLRESWKLTYLPHDGNLGGMQLQSPYWLLVVAIGVFAASPWIPIRRRFSLRTLLIGMTVVAVLLGSVVWAVC